MIVERTDLFDFKVVFNDHELKYVIDLADTLGVELHVLLTQAINQGLTALDNKLDSGEPT